MSRYYPAPEEDKESVLDLIRKGYGIRSAEAALGYSSRVSKRWSEKDPEYAKKLAEAREIGVGAIEKRLDDRILRKLEKDDDLSGAESNLIMFRLKHHDPTYRESSPGIHFHANVEYKSMEAGSVRKILEEAGAFETVQDAEIVSESTGREVSGPKILPSPRDT